MFPGPPVPAAPVLDEPDDEPLGERLGLFAGDELAAADELAPAEGDGLGKADPGVMPVRGAVEFPQRVVVGFGLPTAWPEEVTAPGAAGADAVAVVLLLALMLVSGVGLALPELPEELPPGLALLPVDVLAEGLAGALVPGLADGLDGAELDGADDGLDFGLLEEFALDGVQDAAAAGVRCPAPA